MYLALVTSESAARCSRDLRVIRPADELYGVGGGCAGSLDRGAPAAHGHRPPSAGNPADPEEGRKSGLTRSEDPLLPARRIGKPAELPPAARRPMLHHLVARAHLVL